VWVNWTFQCKYLKRVDVTSCLSAYVQYTGCIKMIGAVLMLIIFTSMVNRIINTSRNERVTQHVYDTYLQMFDVCSLRYTAHIEAIFQFHTKRFLLRSRHYRFVPSQTERKEGSGIAHAHKIWTPAVSFRTGNLLLCAFWKSLWQTETAPIILKHPV